MAFLEDPRLRQRWNQIAHDAETATENAAAGIWSFSHHYINPCFSSVSHSFQQCTTVCLGDPEERLRKRRERDRARAEYSFDFYDDWYEEEANGGLLGSWGNEDWDRLLAGTGNDKRHLGGETNEQPRRKRGMSYGTRAGRRKTIEQDPTIIPSTQPIGFLSKLPWKMGGTLRYKPSAADLQDNPRRHGDGESEPLLGTDDEEDFHELRMPRKRSGTTGSGDTSDSYRSRGDLFPSDGEGEEDAVALDDEVTYEMIRKDDRSSGKSGRARSMKGKGLAGSRTVSRTTLGSAPSMDSLRLSRRSSSLRAASDADNVLSFEDLEQEEQMQRNAEEEEVARKKEAAAQIAAERGLGGQGPGLSVIEAKHVVAEDEVYQPEPPQKASTETIEEVEEPQEPEKPSSTKPVDAAEKLSTTSKTSTLDAFVPARLPNFG